MSGKSAVLVLGLTALGVGGAMGEQGSGPDLSRIERLTGAKGYVDVQAGVVRVSLPHSGLVPKRPRVRLAPRLGPESWVAFRVAGDQTKIEGALIVPEDLVDATLSAALDAGLEVVTLQQHFVWDHPNVLRLQIRGTGKEEAVAAAVGTLFAKMRESVGARREAATVSSEPVRPSLMALVQAGLGVKGDLADGVYRVSLGDVGSGEAEAGATWAAFTGSLSRAVVAGDIVVGEAELQHVLRRLRSAGISVVAIEPEIPGTGLGSLCVHYWGAGQGQALVEGLRSATSRGSGAPRRGF